MSPRRASTGPIDRLLTDLHSSDALRRDTAVARLRVLGARAFSRLAVLIGSDAPADARALALAALEGTPNPRVVEVALACLDAPESDVVVAALGVLRAWVAQEQGTRLLEAIAAVAVDRLREPRIRLAAIDALSELPEDLLRPIREQGPPPEAGGPPLDNPVTAREWIEAHGANATLATLHDTVKAFRDCEATVETSRARQEWMRARGAVHQVLAARGSRLALYDARETVKAAHAALPAGYLEALARLGDASCLEPLARAWSASQDAAWRSQLSITARQIMTRHRLGSRNAVVKGIRAAWTGFV